MYQRSLRSKINMLGQNVGHFKISDLILVEWRGVERRRQAWRTDCSRGGPQGLG